MEGKKNIDQWFKDRVSRDHPEYKPEYWEGFEKMLHQVPPAVPPATSSGLGRIIHALTTTKGIILMVSVITISTSAFFVAQSIREKSNPADSLQLSIPAATGIIHSLPYDSNAFLGATFITPLQPRPLASLDNQNPFWKQGIAGTTHNGNIPEALHNVKTKPANERLHVENEGQEGSVTASFQAGDQRHPASSRFAPETSNRPSSSPKETHSGQWNVPKEKAAVSATEAVDYPLGKKGTVARKEPFAQDNPLPSKGDVGVTTHVPDKEIDPFSTTEQETAEAIVPGNTGEENHEENPSTVGLPQGSIPEPADTLTLVLENPVIPQKGPSNAPFLVYLNNGVGMYQSIGNTAGFTSRQKASFFAGAGVEYRLNPTLSLSAEGNYLRISGHQLNQSSTHVDYLFYKWTTITSVENRTFDLLHMPALLHYHYQRHNVGAGPFFTYLLSSEGERTIYDSTQFFSHSEHARALNYLNGYNRFQYGISMEYSWQFYRQHAILIRYNRSLTGFSQETAGVIPQNNHLHFLLIALKIRIF